MTVRIYKGHPGPGAKVTGEALVASDNFSARYDLDLKKGLISRPAHKLAGQSYVGKILILNIAQGAAFADLPLIDRFELDITTAIKSGETVVVDPAAGTLTVGA
jgi:predicted aconitase with swiveling domain